MNVQEFVDRRIALSKALDAIGKALKHEAYERFGAGTITEAEKAKLLENAQTVIMGAGDLSAESEDEVAENAAVYLQHLDEATTALRERTDTLVSAVSIASIAAGLVDVSASVANFFSDPSAAKCMAIIDAVRRLNPTVS